MFLILRCPPGWGALTLTAGSGGKQRIGGTLDVAGRTRKAQYLYSLQYLTLSINCFDHVNRMSLRERKKQAARNAIIEAASNLIGHHGYEQAKMRDIARAADVSYQTLYNYFPTKALIVQAMLTAELETIDDLVNRLMAQHGQDPITLLRAVIRERFDVIGHDNRDLWREVAIEYLKSSTSFASASVAVKRDGVNRVSQILQAFQSRGRLDTFVDTAVLATIILSLIDIAMLQYMAEPQLSRTDILEALDAQFDVVLRPYLREP